MILEMKTYIKNPKIQIENKPPHALLTCGMPFILRVGDDVNMSNPLNASIIFFIIFSLLIKVFICYKA